MAAASSSPGAASSAPSSKTKATPLTYELEQQRTGEVKLTVTHEIDHPDSKMIKAVSGGWPAILSSLKTLLETGESLGMTRRWPKGA